MKQKQTWTLREAGSLALKIIVMVFAVTGTLMSMGAGICPSWAVAGGS